MLDQRVVQWIFDGSNRNLRLIPPGMMFQISCKVSIVTKGTIAPVAGNPRQGSRLAITAVYREEGPTDQTLPLCNPKQHEPVAARKGEQTDNVGAAALYVDRILIWGAGLTINKASFGQLVPHSSCQNGPASQKVDESTKL